MKPFSQVYYTKHNSLMAIVCQYSIYLVVIYRVQAAVEKINDKLPSIIIFLF